MRNYNVYHRSEITGGLCRYQPSAMTWNEATYVRDYWNKRNPFHKGGAWIDYHNLGTVSAEVGRDPPPTSRPASTQVVQSFELIEGEYDEVILG